MSAIFKKVYLLPIYIYSLEIKLLCGVIRTICQNFYLRTYFFFHWAN